MLVIISIYDIIAVWKSKHMVKLANFQTDQKVFAGLFIPYSIKKNGREIKTKVHWAKKSAGKSIRSVSQKGMPPPPKPKDSNLMDKSKVKAVKAKNAILGGGDIGFPLLFAGAVMKAFGFGSALIIVALTTVALTFLLFKAEKDKFYPAMPFISAGCFLGLLVVYLFSMI